MWERREDWDETRTFYIKQRACEGVSGAREPHTGESGRTCYVYVLGAERPHLGCQLGRPLQVAVLQARPSRRNNIMRRGERWLAVWPRVTELRPKARKKSHPRRSPGLAGQRGEIELLL